MFTPNELWNLWQVENLGEYFGMGSHPYFGKFYAASQSRLLMDFINKADEAISKDKPFANFRFGHDSYITPLVILMGLKDVSILLRTTKIFILIGVISKFLPWLQTYNGYSSKIKIIKYS